MNPWWRISNKELCWFGLTAYQYIIDYLMQKSDLFVKYLIVINIFPMPILCLDLTFTSINIYLHSLSRF